MTHEPPKLKIPVARPGADSRVSRDTSGTGDPRQPGDTPNQEALPGLGLRDSDPRRAEADQLHGRSHPGAGDSGDKESVECVESVVSRNTSTGTVMEQMVLPSL